VPNGEGGNRPRTKRRGGYFQRPEENKGKAFSAAEKNPEGVFLGPATGRKRKLFHPTA